jgi:hypothetical protein
VLRPFTNLKNYSGRRRAAFPKSDLGRQHGIRTLKDTQDNRKRVEAKEIWLLILPFTAQKNSISFVIRLKNTRTEDGVRET